MTDEVKKNKIFRILKEKNLYIGYNVLKRNKGDYHEKTNLH